jgi:hypothetical protein
MRRLIDPKFILAGLAVAALALFRPALSVKAFNPQPDPPVFGLIGIDPLETVRLNAVCAATPLPGGVNPGPCDVTLAFLDINGRAINRATHTLQPGESASLDLTGVPSGARRTEVQPFVPASGLGFVVVTVEVFDNNTGRTTAVLNPTEPKSLSSSGAQ